jgi:hypothetical protein
VLFMKNLISNEAGMIYLSYLLFPSSVQTCVVSRVLPANVL